VGGKNPTRGTNKKTKTTSGPKGCCLKQRPPRGVLLRNRNPKRAPHRGGRYNRPLVFPSPTAKKRGRFHPHKQLYGGWGQGWGGNVPVFVLPRLFFSGGVFFYPAKFPVGCFLGAVFGGDWTRKGFPAIFALPTPKVSPNWGGTRAPKPLFPALLMV